MLVGILAWIVVGLLVGFVASRVVNLRGDDARFGIGVAAGAALIGGILYTLISGDTVRAWNPWSLVFATIAGVVGAVVWHVIRSRYASHDRQSVRRSY